jgi:hypothetical protein
MKISIESTVWNLLEHMALKVAKGKRRKLNSTDFEKKVKKAIGGFEAYSNDGGYPKFVSAITKCVEKHLLSEMITSKMNKRIPALRENFWIEGRKISNKAENKNPELEMGDILNFDSYKMNKIPLTSQEYLKIERIYSFLKNDEENHLKVIREERSLMLFYDLDTGNIEPEKFLSSSKGKSLLHRLGLKIEDLNCEVIRDPYDYWKLPTITFNDINDVLIVEGRATYKTFEKLLSSNSEWLFGTRPQMLIFGGGKAILSSFEYTEVLFGTRKNMNFRYFGDLDPEGYTIYYQLIERYEDYQIFLEPDCYRFIKENAKQYVAKIYKDQVMNINSFLFVSEELDKTVPGIRFLLNELWEKRLRIAQEAINRFTISKQRRY